MEELSSLACSVIEVLEQSHSGSGQEANDCCLAVWFLEVDIKRGRCEDQHNRWVGEEWDCPWDIALSWSHIHRKVPSLL